MSKLENLKLEDLVEATKLNRLINDKVCKKEEPKEKTNVLLWVLAIIGAVAAVAAIAYAVYRYLTPDYLDVFEDEFEDDFDDIEDDEDIFEDEAEK